jgi:hypothetical protein
MPALTAREMEVLGAMLDSIDTAWSSNVETPLLRHRDSRGTRAR